jgi:hypothetical protein
MGFFAALALGLAMVGIYGVFSFGVAARTREFGIRIATGARSADILWLVAGEGCCSRPPGWPWESPRHSSPRASWPACCMR